ncbi:hypothetical protein [Portibacter marinus]|nr:hypothetical protein [Portibacter marinus]
MEPNKYDSTAKPAETIGIKDGKYLVKFPFLDIPVEIGDHYYKKHLDN